MKAAKLFWEKAHWLTRIPGIYRIYLGITNLLFPDGKVVLIRNGPLTGLKWQRFRCHQAWMAMGIYEPHVSQLIGNILQPGDIFYDIGANAGYFTLVAAQKVGSSGFVFAFDPVTLNSEVIKKQIALNDLGSFCKVEALAISNHEGKAPFVIPSRNANAHLVDIAAPNVQADGEIIEVKLTTLDQFVLNHPHPTLIKMDIEGAEVAALEGANQLLSGPEAPVMLVSTHSVELDARVKHILKKHGYGMINLSGFEQMVYARPNQS